MTCARAIELSPRNAAYRPEAIGGEPYMATLMLDYDGPREARDAAGFDPDELFVTANTPEPIDPAEVERYDDWLPVFGAESDAVSMLGGLGDG